MFCTQPFNHIDVVVENDKVLLQPCNVWTAKKLNIKEYKNNIQQVKDTLSKTYYYPGCEVCYNEDKNNVRSRRVAQNEFSQDNNLSISKYVCYSFACAQTLRKHRKSNCALYCVLYCALIVLYIVL